MTLNLIVFSQILQEEIGPRIERLKKERFQYFELQKVEREYDHLVKIHEAYKYIQFEVWIFDSIFSSATKRSQLLKLENVF